MGLWGLWDAEDAACDPRLLKLAWVDRMALPHVHVLRTLLDLDGLEKTLFDYDLFLFDPARLNAQLNRLQ